MQTYTYHALNLPCPKLIKRHAKDEAYTGILMYSFILFFQTSTLYKGEQLASKLIFGYTRGTNHSTH